MIYSNLYGFNVVTDYDLPAIESYKADMILPQLPTLKVRVKKQLDNRIAAGICAERGSVKVTYSSTMNYAEVNGKYEVEITAEGIRLSDSVSNAENIYAEITGPSIIMASRFHNRAVLHGSAFLFKNKAYLIIALSGSGKSTLTSALVKYQQIDYITDDIICIAADGKTMFNGFHIVHLNGDSWEKLGYAEKGHDADIIFDRELKLGYSGKEFNTLAGSSQFEIGGTFFLYPDVYQSEIKIEEFGGMEYFIEAIRNVKIRESLTEKLLVQEWNILHRFTENTFACRLYFPHDYEKIREVTDVIVTYLDKERC